MFDFVWKVKESFRKVKRDVEDFRENVNGWVVFLDNRGNEMEKRLDKMGFYSFLYKGLFFNLVYCHIWSKN